MLPREFFYVENEVFILRAYLLSIWSLIDPVYYLLTRLSYLVDQNKKRHIFRVRLTKYKGKSVVLADGTSITKDDLLIKIHLHNARLIKEMQHIDGDIKRARYIYKQVENSLPLLSKFLFSHPRLEEIKGIIGITVLNKGCKRLGFEVYPISNKLYCLFKKIVAYPIYLLATSDCSFKSFKKQNPEYLFMSKDYLLSKYPK